MPRRQKKYHYIYKTTCQITGKFYVGMHSTDNIDDGYLGSGKILGYSRRKYGDENHKKEILEMCPSREALRQREKEIVNGELLKDPLNINLKYGGDGGWDHSNSDSQVQSARGIRGNAKMALLRKTDSQWATSLSRKHSVNMKRLITEGVIKTNTFSGRTHSDATLKKMRDKKVGHGVGSLNSQFGTCWVTNGAPIKIAKEHLDKYLELGYRRGRK